MDNFIYMDHAATTPLKKEVLDEMYPYLTKIYANPSSLYAPARLSKAAIDNSRDKLSLALNASSREIYFTSGGSEADNLAIKGTALANRDKGNEIITSAIEHPAVLNTCKGLSKEGFKITYLPVNKDGFVSIQDLKKSITDKTILVSIMFANNEIGTIQPIKEIGELCREKGIIFHTDAVQAAGSIPIDVKSLNIDLLSLSGHKFYGPKGIGALYVRKGIKFNPLIEGGSQERGKRAGTENVAGIVGLGKAIEIASHNMAEESKRISELRDYLINGLLSIDGTSLNGSWENRLPNNVNVSFESLEGETLLMMLDNIGICVSSGSACSSLSLEPSHVLLGIGLSEKECASSVRFTLGEENSKEQIDYVVIKVKDIVERLRNINSNWNSIRK
ncbi:MAG: cysteine desulfurase NifS [Bacillota bacterium]|nr:cysteine desulfurase NifS [Bacillota bacterium]